MNKQETAERKPGKFYTDWASQNRKKLLLYGVGLFVVFLLLYLLGQTFEFGDSVPFQASALIGMVVGLLLSTAASYKTQNAPIEGITRSAGEYFEDYWPWTLTALAASLFAFLIAWEYIVRPQTVDERNELLRTFIAGVGGFVLIVQLWIAILNKSNSDKTLRLSEDRHLSELFHNASGRLSGDEVQATSGLYSLESIAESSDKLYRPAMNMVATYIRTNSSAKVWGEDEDYQQGQGVVIAWGILGRRRGYVGGLEEQHPLYMHDPILTDIQIHDGDFGAIKFLRAEFKSVLFMSCRMNGTRFVECNFKKVRFVDCDMRGAKFIHCEGRFVNFEVTDKVPKLRTPRGVVKHLDEGTAAINVIVERVTEDATSGFDFLTEVDAETSPDIQRAIGIGIQRAKDRRDVPLETNSNEEAEAKADD